MRISITTLDEFRLVCTEDWAETDRLIAKIKGEPEPPTWKMLAGTAWGKILNGIDEPIEDGRYRIGDTGGWFDEADVEKGMVAAFGVKRLKMEGWRYESPGVFECKVEHEVYGDTIVGKADYVVGKYVHEYKCKFGRWSVDDYADSVQWKFYLDALGGEKCIYHCFDFSDADDEGRLHLLDTTTFTMLPYHGMTDDWHGWLERFKAWVNTAGLASYLPAS